MTYNDPNDRTNPPRYEDRADRNNSTMMWLGGLLALALIVGGIFWATSDRTSTMADRPAATTGTGTTATTPRTAPVQPTNPAGSAPTAPAPTTAPSNR